MHNSPIKWFLHFISLISLPKDEKYSHITKEERDEVRERVLKSKQFIADVEVKTRKTAKTDSPPVLVDAIDKHWKKFIDVYWLWCYLTFLG